MNEAAESSLEPEIASVPERQIDRQILTESKLYSVPYRAYSDMTPRERGAVKARWAKKVRGEATLRRLDPDEFVAMTEEAREAARKSHPEQPRAPRPAQQKQKKTISSFQDVADKYRTLDDSDEPEEEESEPEPRARRSPPVADMYDEGLASGDPHSPMDEVPATEDDPRMRTTATLGEVRPTDNQDLVGWATPRNLRDVYARYTVGDGQHFIRVERIDPKVWQQIPCAGYLGEIREPISEPEFHAWYGGRVYALTVYGPDPKGRRDSSTGLPVIKAKTEPFRYTVPMLPPNLSVLPGTNPTKQQGETQMHPFTMPQQGAMPATPADATMHRTTIDFLSTLLSRGDKEREELRHSVMQGGGQKEVVQAVTEANKAAIEAANRAAEMREKTLQEQLSKERDDRRRLEEKLDKLVEQQHQGRSNPAQDAAELMRVANPGKNAEEQVTRMRDSHKEEMDRLREGHKEALSALKERQDDELKRVRLRLDDVEKHGRDKVEEVEKRLREREKELRDQMDQQRRDERDSADRRVSETVARFEDRLKDIREQHTRELRMQESQHVTRVDTTKSAWDMQLANQKERNARLEEELAAAKEEAEQSKDPVAVIGKITSQAEALGFSKKDENEPQTAWERFAATTGMGLSKALESIDTWLPKAMAARGAEGPPTGAPRMLPPGAQPQPQQQQRQPQRPQVRRTPAWATQGSIPVANHHPTIPPDVQPQQQPQVQVQPQTPFIQPMQVAQPVSEPVQQQPMQPEPQHVPQEQPEQQSNGESTNQKFGSVFPDDVIVQFRSEVERAISAGMPPSEFARRFVEAFPEPSLALVRVHKPEDFGEIVKKMPQGAESVILRRDGKKWIEKLWQEIVGKHQTAAQVAQQGAVS